LALNGILQLPQGFVKMADGDVGANATRTLRTLETLRTEARLFRSSKSSIVS